MGSLFPGVEVRAALLRKSAAGFNTHGRILSLLPTARCQHQTALCRRGLLNHHVEHTEGPGLPPGQFGG